VVRRHLVNRHHRKPPLSPRQLNTVRPRAQEFGYAAARTSPRTRSAHFSPIMIVAALVLPETSVGITDASAMRRPAIPWTRRSGPTTAIGPVPIVQVLVG